MYNQNERDGAYVPREKPTEEVDVNPATEIPGTSGGLRYPETMLSGNTQGFS